jgi:uncharacterized protein
MGRIVFWLLVIAAAYVGYQWLRAKQQLEAKRDAAGGSKIETMVRCEVCGLNLPESEAVGAAGHWYCGEDHRRSAGRGRSGA